MDFFFARDHFVSTWLVLHRVGDRHFGRFVIVFVDLLVIVGSWVNEHAAYADQVFRFVLGDDSSFDRIGNSAGYGCLSWAKHLDRLFHPFDGNFGDHHSRWLNRQVRCQYRQQVCVTFALSCQCRSKCGSNWSVLAADHQVNMSDFVPVASQCFTNIH